MNKIIEIRWHGRGGQGAKTAALLLAETAFQSGKFVQGFPEYGSERMGAPITSYTRIADQKITIHCNIYEPDYVVVIDDSLLSCVDVCAGIKLDGALIVNSEKDTSKLQKFVPEYQGKIYSVNARAISEKALGQYFPNMPMLGAIVKISNIIPSDQFLIDLEQSLRHKFSRKPDVVKGNLQAIKMAMQEV